MRRRSAAEPAVIGWMSYSNFYGRPAYSGTAEVSIYIAEAWRGKGLGRYCLEQAIEHRAEDCRAYVAGVYFWPQRSRAWRCSRSLGFETWANLPRVANLDGVERDLIILGKRVA